MTEQRREPVTTVPDSEGRVRCPLPDCGKLLGSYIPAKSQYYCRHCRVEVMVGTPSLEMRWNAYDLSLSASNMSKAQMLALFLVTDARTCASRARALELIAALPDEEPALLPDL